MTPQTACMGSNFKISKRQETIDDAAPYITGLVIVSCKIKLSKSPKRFPEDHIFSIITGFVWLVVQVFFLKFLKILIQNYSLLSYSITSDKLIFSPFISLLKANLYALFSFRSLLITYFEFTSCLPRSVSYTFVILLWECGTLTECVDWLHIWLLGLHLQAQRYVKRKIRMASSPEASTEFLSCKRTGEFGGGGGVLEIFFFLEEQQ